MPSSSPLDSDLADRGLRRRLDLARLPDLALRARPRRLAPQLFRPQRPDSTPTALGLVTRFYTLFLPLYMNMISSLRVPIPMTLAGRDERHSGSRFRPPADLQPFAQERR